MLAASCSIRQSIKSLKASTITYMDESGSNSHHNVPHFHVTMNNGDSFVTTVDFEELLEHSDSCDPGVAYEYMRGIKETRADSSCAIGPTYYDNALYKAYFPTYIGHIDCPNINPQVQAHYMPIYVAQAIPPNWDTNHYFKCLFDENGTIIGGVFFQQGNGAEYELLLLSNNQVVLFQEDQIRYRVQTCSFESESEWITGCEDFYYIRYNEVIAPIPLPIGEYMISLIPTSVIASKF